MMSTLQPVLDLATCLTGLGFAQVTEIPRSLADDPQLVQYFANLKRIQQRAKRSRHGLWAERYIITALSHAGFRWACVDHILLISLVPPPPISSEFLR